MIDLGAGVAIGCFFIAGAGVIVAGIRKSKNGNGNVTEKLCVARREQCDARFDRQDESLAELHRKIDNLIENMRE